MKTNPAYAVFALAVLVSSWPDGTTLREPAHPLSACLAGAEAEAALTVRAVPEAKRGQRATAAYCLDLPPEQSGFPAGWDCIQWHNCR